MRQVIFYLGLVWGVSSISVALARNTPELMLAKVFYSSVDVTEYWVSEKLDGVRARWDGHQLISRGGMTIHAPDWFIDDFPVISMDGELWAGRGKYQQTVSIVRTQKPHVGWEKIRFMVFDLPDYRGDFSSRVAKIHSLFEQDNNPYLGFISQFRVNSRKELLQQLKTVTDQGGEGLMLHYQAGIYHSGRSNDLLKLKPFTDADAVVIAYRKGKGKFTGKMGAIQVRTVEGKIFLSVVDLVIWKGKIHQP